MTPSSPVTSDTVALTYAHLGRNEDALRLISAGAVRSRGAQGYIYAVAGHRKEAMAVINQLRDRAAQDFEMPYEIAAIFAGMGEKEDGIAWLEKSYATGDPTLNVRLMTDPKLDPLRSEPRFRSLITRMTYPR